MMKKQACFFLGIDVSKLWFDISLMPVVNYQKGQMITERFDNKIEGLHLLKKWLKEQKVTFDDDTLLAIENTGIYHRLLWKFFCDNNIPIHIGNAAHIKKSFGIARGKNDKIDSQRLLQAHSYLSDISVPFVTAFIYITQYSIPIFFVKCTEVISRFCFAVFTLPVCFIL